MLGFDAAIESNHQDIEKQIGRNNLAIEGMGVKAVTSGTSIISLGIMATGE